MSINKNHEEHTPDLPQKLRDELQAYLDMRQNVKTTDPLFVTAGRERFTANVLTQHFYWMFQKAGIAGTSSHSMRRTFIKTLATKGIGVRVLASLAAPRSITVTQRGIDVNDDMKRNAFELV